MSNLSKKTQLMVYTGILSAMSIVLYFIEFPIIPGVNYLMIDASDLPAALAGVLFSPVAAIIVEAIKTIVHLFIKGFGSTMGFGDLMNLLVGTALTTAFSGVFHIFRKKDKKTNFALIFATVAGVIAMVLMGIVGNYFIAPPYFNFFLHVELSNEALWAAIGGATILNIVKSLFVAILMFPIINLVKHYTKNKFNL